MKRSRAFTVIELLAVMGIVSILVALLIPSLFLARERARRIQCLNNLKQISMALQSYTVTYEMLPPGSMRPASTLIGKQEPDPLSWTVQLLPYLEQSMLAASIDDSWGGHAPANATASITSINTLMCPGTRAPLKSLGQPDAPLSSYAGCHHDVEAPIDLTNHGVLFLNSTVRPEDVADGLSQTIFVGEVSLPSDLGWISGTRATLRNTGHPINGVDPGSSGLSVRAGEPSLKEPLSAFDLEQRLRKGSILTPSAFVGGFGSNHPGDGAQFAFGDGSARFVKSSIHQDVYRRLGNRSDGEIIDDDSF